MKKHQNHRYFTAVCIASAIFAVLLCLALFLIVMGDRSELERVEAQAAVFLEQMEQAADSARQSALAGAGKGTVQRIPCALSGTGSGSPDRRAEGDRRKGILARSYGYLCKGCVCGGQCRMHGLFEPAGARTSGFFPVGRGFGNCIEFLREVG